MVVLLYYCHTMLFALDILFLWVVVSIRMLLQLSPPPLRLTRFSPGLFFILQEILVNPFFALIRLFQKIIHFKSKAKFLKKLNKTNLIKLINGRFWICCFVYMCFLGCFSQSCHHETTNSFLFARIYSFLFGHSSSHVA